MLFWFAVAGVGALFLAHTAPFPFLIDLLNGKRAVWKMPADGQRRVYLTFDDGPNPSATPALLDALAAPVGVLARERGTGKERVA